jgi:hypothetical protein
VAGLLLVGDLYGALSHPKISILGCAIENTKNKTKDFTIL